jgi:hypothetical protein
MSKAFPSTKHRTLLLSTLRLIGVKTITVSFQGSGDSGEITGAEALDVQGKPVDISKHSIEWEETYGSFCSDQNKWVEGSQVTTKSLEEIFTTITECALEEQGLDWYNNDGGQGDLTIDLSTSPPTIELNVGINYMETTQHSFDYTEEIEEDK